MDVGRPVFVEEGLNVESIGSESVVGWARIWLDISGYEEQEGYDKWGIWLGSIWTLC